MEIINETSSFIENNDMSSFIENNQTYYYYSYYNPDLYTEEELYREEDEIVDDLPDGYPYFKIHGTIFWGFVLAVVVIGLVGNILVLVLMNDTKVRRLSYSVYLKFMAVSDTCLLGFKLQQQTEQVFRLNIVALSDFTCKIYPALTSLFLVLSPWLVVGLTLDRCVCVCFPLTRERLCTRRKAVLICVGLVVFSLILVVYPLYGLYLDGEECGALDGLYVYYMLHRVTVTSTMPCLFILVLNIVIILKIKRSTSFRNNFMTKTSSNTREKDSSTRPLVLVSVLAFATLLPYSVSDCAVVALQELKVNVKAQSFIVELQPLFHLLYLMNFGQNFYILIASSSTYRNIINKRICGRFCNRKGTKKSAGSKPVTGNALGAKTGVPLSSVTASVESSAMSHSHSAITEFTSASAEINQSTLNSAHSGITFTGSGMTNLTSAQSGMTNLTSTGSGMTNLTSTGSGITNLTSTESGMTNLTSTQSGMTDLTSAQTGMTTLTYTGSGITNLTSAKSGMTDMTSAQTGMTTLTYTGSGITNLTSTGSGMTNLTSTGSGMTNLTSDGSGMTNLTSDGSGMTNLTSDGSGITA